MTSDTITKSQLKGLINRDEWHKIGKIFNFSPVFMLSESGKKYMIDWRCVPMRVAEILWQKNSDKPELSEPVHVAKTEKEPPTPKGKGSIQMRQLEHFGDAIVNLAARWLAKKVTEPTSYFMCAFMLASNSNLKTAGYESGDEAEIEIGTDFVENGLQSAFETATNILKRTGAYMLYHPKDQPVNS